MRYAILLLFLIPVFAVCVSRPATNHDANDVVVAIREYDVPTPNSRPHDPAVAPDGALWYTGQLANKLGRLDPKSGEIKEYSLKTPDSGPHGLAADREGNIWFTANFKAYIGKLDPRSGKVTEYPMPDARAKDPHSLVFDREGVTAVPQGFRCSSWPHSKGVLSHIAISAGADSGGADRET